MDVELIYDEKGAHKKKRVVWKPLVYIKWFSVSLIYSKFLFLNGYCMY